MAISPSISLYPACPRPWGHLSCNCLCKSCPGSTLPVQRHDVAHRRYDLHLEAHLLPPDIPSLSCTAASQPGDDSLDVGALPVLLPKLSGVLPFLCRNALLLVAADDYGPRLIGSHTFTSHRAGGADGITEYEDPYPPGHVILGLAGPP